LLRNGAPAVFSVPLRRGPDEADIRERWIAPEFDGRDLLRTFEGAYRRAPQFGGTMALLERILLIDERNLYAFLEWSIRSVCDHIGIATQLRRSSEISADRTVRGKDRVVAMCRAVGASLYVNPIGGTALYDPEDFEADGLELAFLKSGPFVYPQLGNDFVPDLSIVDVLMFNDVRRVSQVTRSGFQLV
jgi:hypothetical protein